MNFNVVEGDLLALDVEVIVNSWNRNVIPWWLLLPQGVSGAIKKLGGTTPFKELAGFGPIPLGQARITGAGTLKFKHIIHVAGINMMWFATEFSVRESVKNAMDLVNKLQVKSVGFPLIGAGSGNRSEKWSLHIMSETFRTIKSDANVTLVTFKPS